VKFLKAFAPEDEKPKLTNYFTCHAQGENFNVSPSFNFRLLCTVGTGQNKNPNMGKMSVENGLITMEGVHIEDITTTIVIRLDTIDISTLLPCIVGTSMIKLFCMEGRIQPFMTGTPNAYINTGLFQMPIYAGALPLQKSGTKCYEDAMSKLNIGKIPCASLLVRINVKKGDGPGSINAPIYASGAYNGSTCESNEADSICYTYKKQKHAQALPSNLPYSSILTTITTAMKNTKKSNLPPKPQYVYEIKLWLESLLPSYDMINTKQLLDYTYIVPYNDDIGISININQLYNIQPTNKKSIFSAFSAPPPQTIYKAIYSLSDGQGYQNQPIYDDMKFTEHIDINSPSKAPIFIDGFQRFYFKNRKNVKTARNNEISRGLQSARNENNNNENVFLIVDIRSVTINTKTSPDEITVEPNIPGKSYWSILPLCKEKNQNFDGLYVNGGTFVLPLFEGPFPYEVLSKNEEHNVMASLLSLLEEPSAISENWLIPPGGSSVIVTVANPLLANLSGHISECGPLINKKNGKLSTVVIPKEVVSTANIPKDKIISKYLEKIIQKYLLKKKLNNKNPIKLQDFMYDDRKYPHSKNTIEQTFNKKTGTAGVKNVLNATNQKLSTTTGISIFLPVQV